MRSALIGYTGFVGSNLLEQTSFDRLYNSKNIESMRGESFDLAICSGVSAVKWVANKEPEKDWAAIQSLLDVLSTTTIERFVLISTVDVYPSPHGVTESMKLSGVSHHPYGTHRLKVEEFVRNEFQRSHIIRLPGLFGRNLKKNVIFDLLNDNLLDMINPLSSFQYYDLGHLWNDIQKTVEHSLPLVNIATEPIKTMEILEAFFPSKEVGRTASPVASYDMHSEYAGLWGNKGPYQYGKEQVMSRLSQFISEYKKP